MLPWGGRAATYPGDRQPLDVGRERSLYFFPRYGRDVGPGLPRRTVLCSGGPSICVSFNEVVVFGPPVASWGQPRVQSSTRGGNAPRKSSRIHERSRLDVCAASLGAEVSQNHCEGSRLASNENPGFRPSAEFGRWPRGCRPRLVLRAAPGRVGRSSHFVRHGAVEERNAFPLLSWLLSRWRSHRPWATCRDYRRSSDSSSMRRVSWRFGGRELCQRM